MLQKILNWLTGKGLSLFGAKILLATLAAVLLSVGFVGLKWRYDHQIISKHDDKVNVEVLQKVAPANDKAADARAKDTIIIHEKAKERSDAIAKETDQPPTDADIALNCKRLQQDGQDTTAFPACSGR